MSKIAQLSAEEVRNALGVVESALKEAPRPTKAVVMRALHRLNLCSTKSTGIENTLLSAAKRHSLSVPAKFADLMGVISTETSESAASDKETLGVPSAQVMLNFKAVSSLSIQNNRAKLLFNDGVDVSVGNFDESYFRSNCNLIEFRVSSN